MQAIHRPSRDPVKLFRCKHAMKQSDAAAKPFSLGREDTPKQIAASFEVYLTMGPVVWDIIVNLIYQQFCENFLAEANSVQGHQA